MINNSQYMKIIQYLSILGGLEPPPCPPVPTLSCICTLLFHIESFLDLRSVCR